MNDPVSIHEQQINEYLGLTLKLYLQLQKQHRYELASAILQHASYQSDIGLDLYKIRNRYRKFSCPVCGQAKSNKLDQESIRKVGMCFNCDHLQYE